MPEPTKKTPARELAALHGADDLKTPEQREAFVDEATDAVMAEIVADRKKRGLPPLK